MKENFKTFKIKYRADFIGNEDGNVIYVWISKPSNSDTQHVEKFLISEAPQKEYTDPNENIILFFELKNQKKYFIEFYLEITLKKQNDKLTASLNQCLDINYNKNMPFVKSEKYLEQSNELKELANKIVGQQKNTFETIEKIFKFVMKNFTYRYPVKNRGVKNMNFDSLKGDCAEYASLFVALCRNFKIPSQNKTGFVVFPKTKKIIEHGGASVCFKNKNGLDFDPQYGSLEKNGRKYFAQTSDYRITFTKNFNIPLKFAKSTEKNKIIKLTAQTLQPIAFLSKNKIKFKHKIKII